MSILYPKWLEDKWTKEAAEEKRKADILAHYNKYKEDHKVCPICGDGCEQTTGPFGPTPHQYAAQDTNRARCPNCKWEGIVDDLVSEKYSVKYKLDGNRCVCRHS